MSTLHIIHHSSEALLQRCLKHYKSHDAILFICDSVYLAASKLDLLNKRQYFLLKDDVQARGLDNTHLDLLERSINYDEFVQLSLEHINTISWYE